MDGSNVSRLVVGGLTVAIGVFGMLSGFGVLPHGRVDPSIPVIQQQALAVCAGAVFAAGGLSAMLSGLGGNAARTANRVLGFVIVGGLTLLFAWTALGPGTRAFASPLAVFGPRVNAVSGRVLFGVVALMGAAILTLMARGAMKTGIEAQ